MKLKLKSTILSWFKKFVFNQCVFFERRNTEMNSFTINIWYLLIFSPSKFYEFWWLKEISIPTGNLLQNTCLTYIYKGNAFAYQINTKKKMCALIDTGYVKVFQNINEMFFISPVYELKWNKGSQNHYIRKLLFWLIKFHFI
jgi:hypothetical protein